MSWLCWSDASMLPASPPAGAPPTAGAPIDGVLPSPAAGLPTRGPAAEAGPWGLDIVVIGTPSVPPVPAAPRTATAIIGEPGRTRIADSAERTTVFERTSPKRDARGGVGVTRGVVLARATSGRAEMLRGSI